MAITSLLDQYKTQRFSKKNNFDVIVIPPKYKDLNFGSIFDELMVKTFEMPEISYEMISEYVTGTYHITYAKHNIQTLSIEYYETDGLKRYTNIAENMKILGRIFPDYSFFQIIFSKNADYGNLNQTVSKIHIKRAYLSKIQNLGYDESSNELLTIKLDFMFDLIDCEFS